MATNKRFEKLLEPGYIGPVKTRNRIIKTGAALSHWHEDDLHMNNIMKAFYEAIAKGGVGLLILEAPTVDYPLGARWRERYRIDDDKYIKGLSEMTELIHKQRCPIFMQMNHDGPWQSPLFGTNPLFSGPPIGASPINLNIPTDFHRDMPRELTIPEIHEIVDKFASAAVRAHKAGFDGVDINAASSHLLHNFISPFWNRRQDAYGGSVENRARFPVEIIKEIKKRLGQDFPIIMCINGIEIGRAIGIDDSQCLAADDSRRTAQLLQEAGADAIHLRRHWLGYHTAGFLTEQLFYPEPPIPLKSFPKEYNWRRRGAGANTIMAGEMKKAISIPIMVVGRFDPKLGERILREGKADFIAMHRRLMADPELPNKIASGNLDDIAPCTACGDCLSRRFGGRHCRINAFVSTDEAYDIHKAERRKKVLVAGGGPAGMEAARVAALRGHEVMLYEKSKKLGGSLPMATLVKGLKIEDLPAIVRYLKGQINKLGVKTKLGKEVSAATIEEVKPDVVIVATGGLVTVPEIPGINKHNAISGPALHRQLKFYLRFLSPGILSWLSKLWLPIGKKVVIVGGEIHGCQLAEFLVKRGRKVTIVNTAESLGKYVVEFKLGLLLSWFEKKGVAMITGVRDVEIIDRGVTFVTKEGDSETLEADSIITAMPLEPNTELLTSLEGKVAEVYAIGDCKEPQLIIDAITAGFQTARKI